MKKVLTVVGARPNFMKAAPLHAAFQHYPSINHRIVHTGQHYDANMSKVFFEDLELPQPDVYLGVGSGSHATQTAKVMMEFEKAVTAERPDLVIVVGDVNSTVACSLVCAKLGIPVAHVEAGLRSFDRSMPEELNRVVTDSLSDYFFVSEPSGAVNLAREGHEQARIFSVGNVMIDSVSRFLVKARNSSLKSQLGLAGASYALMTIHRPSNVDDKAALSQLLRAVREISSNHPVIFPVHPRTRKMINEFGLLGGTPLPPGAILCDPIGYIDFLSLLASASVVVTDSGGIQEETTYLGIPCLTMRSNTERPVTVTEGTNILLGADYARAIAEANNAFEGKGKKGTVPELWDGKAGERIAKIIHERLLMN